MKSLSEHIRDGLLALEKTFLSQDALTLGLTQWLNGPRSVGLGEHLVAAGLITKNQLDELESETGTTRNLSPDLGTHEFDVTGSFPDNASSATQKWQSPGVPSSGDRSPGERLRVKDSRFQIVKQHAKGGLGVVFVARDSQINRDVALKQIRLDRKQDLISESKFMLEAEITGQLEHPGIVPVYALGTDADGAPYYAMRFIRGRELKRYIQEFHENSDGTSRQFDGVGFRQLLRRFLDVCNAMEYAHSRGILHRDLKPANIMLGNHGETLVVDWGLAKIMEATPSQFDVTESAREFPVHVRSSGSNSETLYGTFSGTVAYAPPEQLQGHLDQLCPASDVYSLGAILYELLTNQAPISQRPNSIEQVVEWLRDAKIPSARELSPIVPKGLSVICKRAMAFEIASRFSTANALCLDLERWLADDRVLAFGANEPVSEKAGRLLRRYKSWTVPIAIAILFSIVVASVGAWLINRARIEESIAKLSAVQYKSDAVNRIGVARNAIDTLLTGSTEALKDFPATRDLQKQLLQAAAEDYSKLSQGNTNDEELELERVRATIRVADIMHMQGDYIGAYDKFRSSIAEIEARVAAIAKDKRKEAALWKMELGKAHGRLGLAYDLDSSAGRVQESNEEFLEAIAILKSVSQANPEMPPVNAALARTQINYANSISLEGKPAESIRLIEDAFDAFDRADWPNDHKLQLARMQAHESMSRALGKLGRTADAIEYLDSGLLGVRKMMSEKPFDRELRSVQSSMQISRATLRRREGDFQNALADLLVGLAAFQQLQLDWPDSLAFAESVAATEADIGLLLLDQKLPIEAKKRMVLASEEYERLFRSYPQIQRVGDGLATALSGLGLSELYTNPDAQLAVDTLIRSYNLYDRIFQESGGLPNYAFKMATVQGQLGQAYLRKEMFAESSEMFSESRKTFGQLIELDMSEASMHPDYASSLAEVEWRQGILEWDLGGFARGKSLFESAIERMKKLTEIYPTNGKYSLSFAYYRVNCPDSTLVDLNEADVFAGRAYSLQPKNATFVRMAAECKARLGFGDAAKQLFESIRVANEVSTEDLGMQALIAFSQRKLSVAEQLMERMREKLAVEQPFHQDLKRWQESIGSLR